MEAPNGDAKVPGTSMGETGDTKAQQQGSWIYVDTSCRVGRPLHFFLVRA